jgi:DNA polymerase
VVLVGEAPGRVEDEGGQPFTGRSGQLLMALVHETLGLTREQCFITNVVKCRPPGNRTPRRGEISACTPWWRDQLAATSGVVVTLGLTATTTVLDRRAPLHELRGRPLTLGPRVLVATYHPAAALRAGPSVVGMMREDFAVVAHEIARAR